MEICNMHWKKDRAVGEVKRPGDCSIGESHCPGVWMEDTEKWLCKKGRGVMSLRTPNRGVAAGVLVPSFPSPPLLETFPPVLSRL